MAWSSALLALALVSGAGALIGAYAWYRSRLRKQAAARKPLPRVPMRSQVIVLPSHVPSVHNAPTREFAAQTEEIAALSMRPTVTRAIGVHRTPSRESSSPRPSPEGSGVEALLRMLGPAPRPSLGNIEIYYRLGRAYLARRENAQARRCFLTVEQVSPGYRDAAAQLAYLPIYAPTVSGPAPAHATPDDAATAQGSTSTRRVSAQLGPNRR